jgi:hypothetical protein
MAFTRPQSPDREQYLSKEPPVHRQLSQPEGKGGKEQRARHRVQMASRTALDFWHKLNTDGFLSRRHPGL